MGSFEIKEKQYTSLLAVICLITSGFVMIGWYVGYDKALSPVSGSATMKFNTALLFFLSSLLAFPFINQEKIPNWTIKSMTMVIVVLSALTLIEYLIDVPFSIDNLFVQDGRTKKFPGRMSPATSLSFMLLGLGQFGLLYRKEKFTKLSQILFLIVLAIAWISCTTYILKIPAEKKSFFWNSMAIHTSVLFIVLAILYAKKNPKVGFMALMNGKKSGSQLIKKIVPILFLAPPVLGFLMIYLVNNDYLNHDFGTVLFTIGLVLLFAFYLGSIAIGLNKVDTERKELEQMVHSSNRKLQLFKDALDEVAIVAITDNRGIINYVNNKFCEISKYDREEIIGRTHSLINSGHHPRQFFKDFWNTINSGQVWSGEIKNKAKDGSYYWVDTAIVPFTDDHGNVEQFMAIRQEITQRKKAEELLSSQFVQKLQQKNKELEQFAFIASHDLQEPLRTIASFSELLKLEYGKPLQEEGNLFIDFILGASSRMTNLITGLLDYSRIDKNLESEVVDCNEIISDVESDLSSLIKNTNTTITVSELPNINGYKTNLRQLFQNLIGNGIKFRKDDSSPKIRIHSEKVNDYWKFSIKDNGIGIPKEHQERIFIIFQRLHTREQYDGTGIGLAHCNKIVELHGGKIWVESEKDKGSTFYFTLKAS